MTFDTSTIPEDAFNATPSDTTLLVGYGFMVCDGLPVTVKTLAGTTVAFPALPPGTQVWLRISQVMATGTTSKQIVVFGPT